MKLVKLLIIMFIILLGGCIVNQDDKVYDDQTIQKAHETIKSYLKNNYENIDTITFTGHNQSPMGGLMIDGNVNDNVQFSISFNEDEYTVGSIIEDDGFPERKAECKEQTCDY